MTVVTAASAADLPSFKAAPPPPPPPAFNWSGFYAGVNLGGNFGGSSVQWSAVDPFQAGLGWALYSGGFVGTGPSAPSGFLGGAQFGYNYQWGDFVVGVEAQFDGATGRTTINSLNAQNLGLVVLFGETATQELNWFGALLGRVGFTPLDRLLVYGAGGFAFGNASTSFTVWSPPPSFPPFYASASASSNTGWAVGGGVEYAITNKITARVEYLHYDLGVTNASVYYAYPSGNLPLPALDAGSTLTATTRYNGNIVRGTLNYRFDFGAQAPIVAKF